MDVGVGVGVVRMVFLILVSHYIEPRVILFPPSSLCPFACPPPLFTAEAAVSELPGYQYSSARTTGCLSSLAGFRQLELSAPLPPSSPPSPFL